MVKKDFYTAQEAMKKLGLAKSTFYDYVKDGRIPQPQLPSFRQRGAMFPASEIDNLANAMKGLMVSYNEEQKQYTFRIARPEDATALSKFSNYVFERVGGYGTPPEIFSEWFKNPFLEVGHLLLRDEHIVGYFTTHTLKDEEVKQVLSREIRLRNIPIEQYERIEPNKQLNIYIGDMAVDPNIKQLSVHLIGKMLSYFHNLGKQGIEIKSIYALASTREGINICRKAGMKQKFIPKNDADAIPFELKVQENESMLTEDYLKALRIYKRKNVMHKASTEINLTAELTAETADNNGQSHTTMEKKPRNKAKTTH